MKIIEENEYQFLLIHWNQKKNKRERWWLLSICFIVCDGMLISLNIYVLFVYDDDDNVFISFV